MSEGGESRSIEKEVRHLTKDELINLRDSFEEFDECDPNGNRTLGSSLKFIKGRMEQMRNTIISKNINDKHLLERRPLLSYEDSKKRKRDLRQNFYHFQTLEKETKDVEDKKRSHF